LRSRARSEREQAYARDEESRTAIHAGLPRTGHASVVCASTAVASSIKHHAIAIRLSKRLPLIGRANARRWTIVQEEPDLQPDTD
jgi:hypothetical protein